MQVWNVYRICSLLLVAGGAFVGGCDHSRSDESQSEEPAPIATVAAAPASTPTPPAELAQQMRPAEQVDREQLLKAVEDAQHPSGNAINDEASFMKAFTAYCSAMQKNGPLSNWTAVIKNIYPGDPQSEDSKNPKLNLTTPGGLEVYEELRPDTPIYNTVLSLKEGDYVRFSITVTHIEKAYGGTTYDECQDPMYHSSRGPHVNKFLVGDLQTLAPL